MWPNGFKAVVGSRLGVRIGRGFVVRALNEGGMIYEREGCRTLAEAMVALEKGLEKWLDENG